MMLRIESITAAQVTENCPAKLAELGQHIAAQLEKAERCDQQADDHRLTAGRLLAQARELCDDGGFTAFHERFCPNLGKTRTYELLAIASGKKSAAQIRAAGAERNKRLRRRKKAAEIAVRHVTESSAKSVPVSRPPITAEQAQAQAAKANAERARAEAVKAKAEEKRATAEAQIKKAEAATIMFGPATKRILSEVREALIAALGELASESATERADAALAVERERARLNLPWDELIVPAAAETERRAA